MALKKSPFAILHCWFFLVLCLEVHSNHGADVAVKVLRSPNAISNRNSAKFAFQVLVGGSGGFCTDCSTNCKLDQGRYSPCKGGKISYSQLVDGNHSFEVCTNGTRGSACASYNWTIDTVPPTAHVTAATSFTNATYVPVNISFSEPCGGGEGFTCRSINACNLLVYGAGHVMPDTFKIIQPGLKFSVMVRLSANVQYGRAIVVMDRDFCTDSAGNKFTRTDNSSLFIHIDRRSVFADIRTHIPEQLLQIDSETRTVLATNKNKNLKIYLYFTEPVMNSSTEILSSIEVSQGSLVPINGSSLEERRFGYQLTNVSDMAVVSVSLDSNLVITRQGTPVSPVTPVTFLYDSNRPAVKLSTTSNMRTKEKIIPILIKFTKPVFWFNSSHISISGGRLQSFQDKGWSMYAIRILADSDIISVNVPENVTADVSGNGNKPSNVLQLKHYHVPVASMILSYFVTAIFAITCLMAGFLTVSTASLLSSGVFSKSNAFLISNPTRNLFRISCHIQVFALSRWLAVSLPVEYFELASGLQWSIPYFNLPWDKETHEGGSNSSWNSNPYSSKLDKSIIVDGIQPNAGNMIPDGRVYGLPLNAIEYRSYFESHDILPEAEYILDPQYSHGWRDFGRSMLWLAVISGILIILHAFFLFLIKIRKKKTGRWNYGALIFPRFEIILLILALPCFCKSSAALIKGGSSSGIIVGVLLLGFVSFLLLALLLFLSIGITAGKLLQYKEVHHEGLKFHWYQELIRVTLGPGKRGQWTWKNEPNSRYLTIFGPLFEDLRGPPKYMLSQITGNNFYKASDRIIASDDETEDAEAPFIQKLFGILRIYYTFLESVKRAALGILAGAYCQTWTSKTPTIILLCIASFQLFFMVLKKPFIKKKVQLVEIVMVASQVALFAFCIVLLNNEFSSKQERNIGIGMVFVFLFAFLAQMVNEWYALYKQTKQLDPGTKSFWKGLKTAFTGFVLLFCPSRSMKNLDSASTRNNLGETVDTTTTNSSAERNTNSYSRDKPWLRQLRELAKSSFSKERGNSSTNDPTSSTSKTRWSGFWRRTQSGSSSASTSADFKEKPRGLHKELEAIFAAGVKF